MAAVLRWPPRAGIPVIPRGAGSNLCRRDRRRARRDRAGADPDGHGSWRSAADELLAVVEAGRHHRRARRRGGRAQGLLYAPDPGSRTVSTVGGQRRHLRRRAARAQVRRDPQLRARARGRAAHRRGDPHRRAAVEGRRRLRPHPAAHRLGGHARGASPRSPSALLPMPATAGTGVAYFDPLADAGPRGARRSSPTASLPATLEFLDRRCINAVEDYAHLGLRPRRRRAAAVRRRRRARTSSTATWTGWRAPAPRSAPVASTLAERRRRVRGAARGPPLLAAGAGPARADHHARGRRRCRGRGWPRWSTAIDEIARATRRRRAPPSGTRATATCTRRSSFDPARRRRAASGRSAAFDEIFQAAMALGGTITGEHGVGAAKRPWLAERLGADQMALLRRVKAAFDPAGHPQPRKARLMSADTAARRRERPTGAIFDPDLLSACISCGFCLPACPTYALTQDERSSPRGRITLMRALEDGPPRPGRPDPAGAGVVLPGLPGLRAGVPGRGPVRRSCSSSGATTSGAAGTCRRWPWRSARPRMRMTPAFTARRDRAPAPPRRTGRRRRRARPHLMLGCAERALFPGVSRAVLRLLPGRVDVPVGPGVLRCAARPQRRLGEAAGDGRGAGRADAGRRSSPRRAAARRTWRTCSGASGCASCRSTCSSTGASTPSGCPQLRRLTVDGRPARVGLQDSCHLRNGLGVTAQPRELIGRVADYVELPSAGACCGSAGTYSLLRPKDVPPGARPQARRGREAGLDYLVAVNPGCLRQWQTGLARRKSRIRCCTWPTCWPWRWTD